MENSRNMICPQLKKLLMLKLKLNFSIFPHLLLHLYSYIFIKMRLLKFLLIADNHIFFIGSSFFLSDFKKTSKICLLFWKFKSLHLIRWVLHSEDLNCRVTRVLLETPTDDTDHFLYLSFKIRLLRLHCL